VGVEVCAASLRPIRQDAPVVNLSDDLARWFGKIELRVEPGAPITALLGELVKMLDALRPTRVDRASSSVHQERNRSVVVVLAHDADEDGGMTIEAGDKSAIISWLSAHEHVDSDDGNDERPWTSVVVDVAAAALRGDYVVEDHYRGSHWVKTASSTWQIPISRG
jgi:hypothetical protein